MGTSKWCKWEQMGANGDGRSFSLRAHRLIRSIRAPPLCRRWYALGLNVRPSPSFLNAIKFAQADSVQNAEGGYVSAEAFAGALIALHELAHLLDAPLFNQDDGQTNANGSLTQATIAAQKANATLLQQKCPNLASVK